MKPKNGSAARVGTGAAQREQNKADSPNSSPAQDPAQDALAFDALTWAFSGQRAMSPSQHRQVMAVAREARACNHESGGKRRSRLWGLGPIWGRFA